MYYYHIIQILCSKNKSKFCLPLPRKALIVNHAYRRLMPKIHLTSKENTIFHLNVGKEKTNIYL